MVEFEMQEDSRHDGWVGEKRENLHLSSAARAEQRQYSIDTSEEYGPENSGPIGRFRLLGNACCILNWDRVGGLILRSGCLRPTDRYNRSTELRVRCKDTVVAMPMQTRRRNELSQTLQ